MIKVVLFDLDGVLVPLVEIHRDAFNQAIKEVSGYKLTEKEHYSFYNGKPSNVKLGMLVNRGIINKDDCDTIWNIKQELTFAMIDKNLYVDDKKIKLLGWLKLNKYKIACISNSIRKTIDMALERTGQLEYMDLIIGNEEFGDKPKPNPYCYEEAMRRFDVKTHETVIVEDSETGIMAAESSKAFVLKVKDPTEVNFENVFNFIGKIK